MFKITIDELEKVTKGRCLQGHCRQRFSGLSIDSRRIKKNNVYIAIKGQRYDGHRFVRAASAQGAAAVVVSRNVKCPLGVAVLRVKDTTEALGRIAAWHRRRFDVPVIAVTGSAGKTTTKDLIAAVLSEKYKVLKNFRTENNHIGVPLTLLKLDKTHQIVVLEMGTNRPGDIAWLARLAGPTIAVMTNIGPSHLLGLKSPNGVFREKAKLLKYLTARGTVFLNGDDRYLSKVSRKQYGLRIVRYGLGSKANLVAKNIMPAKGHRLQFQVNGHRLTVNTPVPHNIYNALAAIMCGLHFKIRYNVIAAALGRFRFKGGRQEMVKAGRFWLIDDTYNANPLSLASAIETLSALPVQGRRIVVCADMLELGRQSQRLHRAAGRLIADSTVDALITIGPNAKYIAQGAGRTNGCHSVHCKDLSEVHQALRKYCTPGDVVLIKGSRAMKMERTVDYFRKHFH